MEGWPFPNGQSIAGIRILEFVDWVATSDRALINDSVPPRTDRPIVALPPMQRTAVWRPKQVVDLWDSLVRGLPIGIFYLVEHSHDRRNIVTLTGETKEANLPGFDLLDGQQRVRALLVGVTGFPHDKRCLWVDLGADEADQRPCLRITSKAQPFGYDARTGNKLRLDERRRARRQIEEKGPLQREDGTGALRPAYDHELFDLNIIQNGNRVTQPPLPYGASEYVFKLHELLHSWKNSQHSSTTQRVDALRAITGNGPSDQALITLHEAFRRIEAAEVALLRVDPKGLRDRDADILELFERIGAGGTPLSTEERLYSIYKSHAPYIRDAVEAIHRQAGRVLPPTKIAATAVRIANAQTHADRNDTPDVLAFAKAMVDPASQNFRQCLNELIPADRDGALLHSFRVIKRLLSYDSGVGHFWIPDALLALFPAELWQVLAFWFVSHAKEGNQNDREEAVRFSLFWYLGVWNNDKAARWAFAHMKTGAVANEFPGAALYKRFIGITGDDRVAHALIPPNEFERRLCKPESPQWRTDAERFVENEVRNDIGSEWWWNGKKLLPWLQKEYIGDAFPDYAPLTDHEDDVPYDVDHICPYSDWGEDWRNVQRRLDVGENESLKNRMRDGRYAVGGGIGNLRLIESSKNRSDQDADIAEKMPFILSHAQPDGYDEQAMTDNALAPEHRSLWRGVSREGPLSERRWNPDRLAAFQKAVEMRAAWLYRRFHDDLGYAAWHANQHDG